MSNKKTILITGAGSGLGEGTAIGLAKAGYNVIAGVHISPQVTSLRLKAEELGLQDKLRVEKLDVLDPFDVNYALTWDIDILLLNSGIGEGGPAFEIPIDLVRRNFESNVFAPLNLAQKFIGKFITNKKKAKVIFTSSMGGFLSPWGLGIYCSTKHAIEAIANSLQQELTPYDIQVQTINPGSYLTGFNETVADSAFRWLDDAKNFTKQSAMKAQFDLLLANDTSRLDPNEMIDAMVNIVPQETGKYRNVVPKFVEDFIRDLQVKAWDQTI
ncbi:SDR family oxidoreductase [Chryseolinea soli]|uniref:SDR family oxidoreductase n=1 Tax=Chryseolinea soli TaxID=2321403 RepID=A0A385SWA8_9BACT|nr:SDR family oxidoreductase [Chryseolinea soli]AYB34836.1 SDR family oxidoreductase [Chryseolinea soli]